MKNETTTTRRKKRNREAYWVVFRDIACDLTGEVVLEAYSPEHACFEAVKMANEENGYGPKEDGGFISIVAYDRSDLLSMLESLKTIR